MYADGLSPREANLVCNAAGACYYKDGRGKNERCICRTEYNANANDVKRWNTMR